MLILFDQGTPKGLARALSGHTIDTAQALGVRRIALVVLTGTTRWSSVRQHADRIAAAVASATPGSYSEVEIPFEPQARRD